MGAKRPDDEVGARGVPPTGELTVLRGIDGVFERPEGVFERTGVCCTVGVLERGYEVGGAPMELRVPDGWVGAGDLDV